MGNVKMVERSGQERSFLQTCSLGFQWVLARASQPALFTYAGAFYRLWCWLIIPASQYGTRQQYLFQNDILAAFKPQPSHFTSSRWAAESRQPFYWAIYHMFELSVAGRTNTRIGASSWINTGTPPELKNTGITKISSQHLVCFFLYLHEVLSTGFPQSHAVNGNTRVCVSASGWTGQTCLDFMLSVYSFSFPIPLFKVLVDVTSHYSRVESNLFTLSFLH